MSRGAGELRPEEPEPGGVTNQWRRSSAAQCTQRNRGGAASGASVSLRERHHRSRGSIHAQPGGADHGIPNAWQRDLGGSVEVRECDVVTYVA